MVSAWGMAAPSAARPPSGHSARRSGAKRYARAGYSLWMIQFLGRWESTVVLDYVEEALAETTGDWG
eukprot:9298949-Heterocapsa_arctica.AAC.1